MTGRIQTFNDLIVSLGAEQVAEIAHRLLLLPAAARLTTSEAAIYLRISPSLLRTMRWRGDGPAYEGRGRLVRYTKASLDAFMRTGAAAAKEAA